MTLLQPGRQANLAALLLLGCATLFILYRWQFSPRAEAAAGLDRLAAMVRIDATQQPIGDANHPAANGATVPELLSRIQEIAAQDEIRINSVTPNPAAPDQFTLGSEGEFRALMRFMARLETLAVTVSSFDLAPAPGGGITANIGITRSAGAGAPEKFADYIDAIAIYSAIRDPFAVGDPVPLPNTGSDLGDLSWTYHLTSISQMGAERVATIDGKDYRVSDTFNGMTVTAIGPSSVSLKAADGSIPQTLHFRRNPEAGDAGH